MRCKTPGDQTPGFLLFRKKRNRGFSDPKVLDFDSPVLCLDFEEGLRVLAHGADLGCLLSDVEVSAVPALPYDDLVLLENCSLLDVLQECIKVLV